MKFVPELIALDYETKTPQGASVDYYRDDFEVWSLSAAWRDINGRIVHFFTCDAREIEVFLKRVSDLQIKVVVHNLMFEYGCTKAKYPDLNINWYSDTLFLAMLYDGGGEVWEEQDDEDWLAGQGLEKCASRILRKSDRNHKKEAHDWLKKHHKIRTNHGKHLDKLPLDILERYNNADTEITLKLYEVLAAELGLLAAESEWVGWEQPYYFYKTRCFNMADAKITGIPVDRDDCLRYINEIDQQIADIYQEFKDWAGDALREIEETKFLSILRGYKREKNQATRWEALLEDDSDYRFNINSGTQMADLFVNKMGIKPPKVTEKGNPSFSTKIIHLWGEGGKILAAKNNRGIVQSQAANMYVDSEYDGERIHIDSKPVGARTYRVSGGKDD